MWPLLLQGAGEAGTDDKFISSFCASNLTPKAFINELGSFTPCFTDVVILGAAHIATIFILLLALRRTLTHTYDHYEYIKAARWWHHTAVAATLFLLLIPLFQLNGRLGAGLVVAPYEWAGFGLSALTWSLLLLLFLREQRSHIVLHGRWSVRFALLLCTSSELVKLHFFLLIVDDGHSYFVYLYLAYVGLQMYLSLLALAWWPTDEEVVLVTVAAGAGEYLPLARAPTPALDPQVCPEATANLFSRLTFNWMTDLMKRGYAKPLTAPDIWKLPPHDHVEEVQTEFQKQWSKQMQKPETASLTRACVGTTASLFLTALPFKLIVDSCQFVGPYFLNKLLKVLASDESEAWKGYVYAGAMLGGSAVGLLADHQHFQRVMRAGFRLKAVLSAAVHRQVFLLSPAARATFTSGRIFNLISSDAETVQMLCQNVFGLLSSPLRIVGAMFLLQQQLGPSSWVAVVAIVLLIPVNAYLVTTSARMLKKALAFTDDRTKLESELVSGIEVVKCSTWEEAFKDRIHEARGREIGMLNKVNILSAVILFILYAVPTVVPVVTFGVYMLLGNELTAAKAFTALALFNVLRFPLFQLPSLIGQVTQAKVSLNRIQEFLSAETMSPRVPSKPAVAGEPAIHMVGDFAWDQKNAPSLTDLNLSIPSGTLVVVVGSTGSGKSTLLSSMLGITQQVYGPPVEMRGKVAYVPQAAFIINATVRDNILFGQPYEPARYRAAVEAANLSTDFALLPGGDHTELGDRGANVSGGQKQRISIARALYANPDVALFDDPLSALDAKVGRKVFEQAIRGTLRDKTVVLTTNQLQFVSAADLVLFLNNGRIAESGTFDELMKAGSAFAAVMKEAQVKDQEEEVEEAEKQAMAEAPTKLQGKGGTAPADTPDAPAPEAAQSVVKIVTEESSSTGGLSKVVVHKYINAMGGMVWLVYLLLGFCMVEVLRVGTTVWLSYWTDSVDEGGGSSQDSQRNLYIYAGISGMQLLAQLFNALDTSRLGLRAARKLHNSLLIRIIAAPMSFFHQTPLGRIVNRLTKDTTDIDRNLASNASFFFRSLLQLVSTVSLIGVIVPFALPAMVVILLLFFWLYLYFQASVRQIKRLDAVSRSPIFSSLSEAIGGVATINAFGIHDQLVSRHASLVDANSVMSLASQSMNRWLSVRLESLSALAAFLAAAVAVEQRGGAGSSGLVVTYSMQITMVVSITIRLASVAENNFNAVERVTEYDGLPSEGVDMSGSDGRLEPPPSWPGNGVVEFKDVYMRYRPGLPLVLRGVTFKAESRQKVAVVGRTGAGKSSMIGCLFRLMEVESGVVEIDGVNIARIKLKQLRSKMAIIPQVPVLFHGSIRMNLSPFGKHNDAELWNALRRAHLAPVVESSSAGLDLLLSEGGAPLSAGQKQLLALARALLNPSRVLVLDEATANVDVETDALIQKTLRSEFADRTMICIAHRLHTVIDYDRILVLDAGKVAEFGAPGDLLSRSGGVFSSLVDETGAATSKFLRSVAAGQTDLHSRYDTTVAKKRMSLCSRVEDCCDVRQLSLEEIAAQLQGRATAAQRLLQDLTGSLSQLAEDEELVEHHDASTFRGSLNEAPGGVLTNARRQMLQALAVLSSIECMAGSIQGHLSATGVHEQPTTQLQLQDGDLPLDRISSRLTAGSFGGPSFRRDRSSMSGTGQATSRRQSLADMLNRGSMMHGDATRLHNPSGN